MRVGVVVYGSLSNTTGGFLYDRRLVDHLRDEGESVEVIELPWRTYSRHLLDNVKPAVRDRLATTSVDVMLQDELCHPSLVRVNRHLSGEVTIVSVVHHLRSSERHSGLQTRFYRAIERRYLDRVDGVICTSHATRSAVDELASPGSSVVAYPGTGRFETDIDAAGIESRAHEPGPLRVLFVGSIIPRKGLHTLIRGLGRVPDDGWRLTVVGDQEVAPDYHDTVQRWVDKLDVRGRVRFTGQLPAAALAAELAAHHVLAVPSTYEGFGMVYLEGMGFGLVPLATTAGGPSDFISDGEDGFLVPPDQPPAIAGRIQSVIDDREKLARLGRAARERYEAHPSWEESMATVHSFLERIAAGTERQPTREPARPP